MIPLNEEKEVVSWSPHQKNAKWRKTSKMSKFTANYWTRNHILPFLFSIALLGLNVLFFLFKIVLVMLDKIEQRWAYWEQSRKQKKQKYDPPKKRVVIVGGGYAGTYAAKKLQHEFDVTLIDAKDYYEFTPSRLRTLVEPWHAYKVKLTYESILTSTRIVTERVQTVTEDVVITDHHSYAYDYLIVATGSRYGDLSFPKISTRESLPLSNVHAKIISARAPNFDLYYTTVLQAKKILVVGGGTVGVELAGEIAEHFEDKEVTIIHSQKQLMNRSPPKVSMYAADFFNSINVNTVTGERIVEQTGVYFKTDLGTVHEADIAFVCTGNVPNSDILRAGFPSLINRWGLVKVNEHLQLPGFFNIFIAGDLSDIPEEEEKLCQTAYDEITIVVANIRRLERSQPLSKYVPAPCPMLISLGKYDGILTYRGWTFRGFIPAVMKEFVEWKEMVWFWDWSHFNLKSKRSLEYAITDTNWRVGVTVV